MEIETRVFVPKPIYDLYAEAAKFLGDLSTEQVMSAALQAYAQHLFQDMLSSGELTEK